MGEAGGELDETVRLCDLGSLASCAAARRGVSNEILRGGGIAFSGEYASLLGEAPGARSSAGCRTGAATKSFLLVPPESGRARTGDAGIGGV
jgi:hypothetical protein